MSLRNILAATASIAVCAVSLPCYAIVTSIPDLGTVNVFVGNSNGTPSATGVAMFAFFTPNDEQTLSEAAKALGYIGFNWQQTITNWANADLHAFNGAPIVPVPSPNPPFLDPPPGGYNYNPCGGKASGASGAASPFYFTLAPSADCWSLSQNETSTTLSFGDEPMDHHLTAAQIAANNIPKFETYLVGIVDDDGVYEASSPLFYWTWQTTYNGAAPGNGSVLDVTSRSANSPMLQPGSGGTGHVTITSIDGVPVPEPPTLSLLAFGVFAMFAARRAAEWNRTRYSSS